MTDETYESLADALDRLPNGFPRTPSNVEIPMLKKIFSTEDASIASQLSGEMETIDSIAAQIGFTPRKATLKLVDMARRGLVWIDKKESEPLRFRLAPFVVGIYEFHLDRMDHEFSHLFEEYMADGGAVGLMKLQPAFHRVVPVRSATKSEWILPYDDVREYILAAESFRLRDCICRVQQSHIGRECEFPLKMCLSFSGGERPPTPDDITREEALAILGKADEVGLVHTVSNIQQGIGYICNCCGCCCAILRGINEWGIEESVAHVNYCAFVDADDCQGCGTCMERCQVHAIAVLDDLAVVERDRCIGCGLCVTGCPHDAVKLERMGDDEIVHPPADFAAWERERLQNRDLSN